MCCNYFSSYILQCYFKRFWDNEKEVIFGVLFTGFLSSLVYRLIQNVDYDWALSKRMFFYSLIVIPVVLLVKTGAAAEDGADNQEC